MLHSLFAFLLFWQSSADSNSALRDGLLALQAGDLHKAESELDSAAKANPQNPYVWTALAETYLRLGDRKQAQSSAEKAQAASIDKPAVWHALAMFYAHAGDFKAAETWEDKYASSKASDPDALSRAAMLALRAEDFSRAAALAETALQRTPNDPQLTLTLGIARYGQRRFDDAITCFLRVIAIDPSIEQPYLFLGRVLDQAGTHLAAITAADEAWLQRTPDSAEAHLMLAKALLQSDPHSERAKELLQKAIQLEPNSWESHYELGVLLESNHDYAGAAGELEAAVTSNPAEAMPHYHLARVYDRLGKADRAKEEREIHERLSSGKSSANSAVSTNAN